jgi:hypothetical protein
VPHHPDPLTKEPEPMSTTLPSRPLRSPARRRLGAAGTGLLLTAAIASGLAACSSDDDASPATTAVSGVAHTVSAEACGAFTQLSALTFQMPEDPAEVADFVSVQMVPVVTTIASGLPADHAAVGTTVLDAYRAAADSRTPEALQDPSVAEAQKELGQLLFEGCDGTRLEVTGVDYAFRGLPEKVDGGPVNIAFTDGGTEEHELMVVKLNPGENLTLDQVLELPPEEAFAHVTPVGVTWGAPGETSYTAMDLEPGTYFALCNIPIGGGEQGAPHHTAGMKQAFVVS